MMRDGIAPPRKNVVAWEANPAQMAAARAAQAVLDKKGSEADSLLAARAALDAATAQQVEQDTTRRYLLALTNRENMAGRYSQLSTVELLDIVATTAADGGAMNYEQYREQLRRIEENARGSASG